MRFVIIAFAASLAFGQTTRVFRLTQNEDKKDLEVIAWMLRETTDIQQLSTDEVVSAITVGGTAEQIAMADWLLYQIDLPPNGEFSGVHEYRPPAGSDDLLRVCYVSHVSTVQELQYIVTAIRAVAHVPRMFVYNPRKAVVMRGTDQQVSLGAWLAEQLNQPANGPAPAPHEYKLPGDDVARVFKLTNPQTTEQLQEIVTTIRSVGDISRVYWVPEQRAVVLRAASERVALAAWLISKLDKPVNGQPATENSTAAHEFRLSGDDQNVVRVFYLAGAQSAEDHQKVASRVRATARTARMYLYSALGALAVRGTVGQIATAEKVIEQMRAQ